MKKKDEQRREGIERNNIAETEDKKITRREAIKRISGKVFLVTAVALVSKEVFSNDLTNKKQNDMVAGYFKYNKYSSWKSYYDYSKYTSYRVYSSLGSWRGNWEYNKYSSNRKYWDYSKYSSGKGFIW